MLSPRPRVLVVDHEADSIALLEAALRGQGYEVATAQGADHALALLEETEPDITLAAADLPGDPAEGLTDRIRRARPSTSVILMTDVATGNAVSALKLGAEDCLSKPVDAVALDVVLQRVFTKKRLLLEAKALRERLEQKYRFDNLIGESPQMLEVFKTVRQVAPSGACVLLLGQSGSGKELLAQTIHQNSPRKGEAYVKVACSALPEMLLESELFGHEKGAFPGAVGSRIGRFQEASGGTVFLDEIADVSLAVQVKLLRFLEDREFERSGGDVTLRADVRVIAASQHDLKTRIKQGTFREDLYYRLKVIEIHVPPLRERRSDVLLLAQHFLRTFAAATGKEVPGLSREATALLLDHGWPGNVRELENAVERAVAMATTPTLIVAHFPTLSAPHPDVSVDETTGVRIPGSTLADIERAAILRTLEAAGGSTSRAARILGISARKIQYKVKEYGSRRRPATLPPEHD